MLQALCEYISGHLTECHTYDILACLWKFSFWRSRLLHNPQISISKLTDGLFLSGRTLFLVSCSAKWTKTQTLQSLFCRNNCGTISVCLIIHIQLIRWKDIHSSTQHMHNMYISTCGNVSKTFRNWLKQIQKATFEAIAKRLHKTLHSALQMKKNQI